MEKKSKNYWSKKYKKAEVKELVIDEMCSSFAHEIAGMADMHVQPRVIHQTMKDYNTRAKRLASIDQEFHEGWKLEKDWFICMVAQLYLHGASEDMDTYADKYRNVQALFEHLKWDWNKASNPTWDDVNTTYDVAYRYTDNGTEETRHYKIVLTPSCWFPDRSKYKAQSDKVWEIIYCKGEISGATVYRMIDDELNKHGNYTEMDMTERVLRGMERIV
jgi:hypothetical protein